MHFKSAEGLEDSAFKTLSFSLTFIHSVHLWNSSNCKASFPDMTTKLKSAIISCFQVTYQVDYNCIKEVISKLKFPVSCLIEPIHELPFHQNRQQPMVRNQGSSLLEVVYIGATLSFSKFQLRDHKLCLICSDYLRPHNGLYIGLKLPSTSYPLG